MKSFDRRRLVGAWQLRRWYFTGPDGQIGEPMGPGAEGLLLFTSDGWASINITAAGRARFSRRDPRAVPVEERAAAFDGLATYACRWRVVDKSVELRVLLSHNPAMVGTVQMRGLQMRGRTLTTTSVEPVPGGHRLHRLEWRPARVPAADDRTHSRRNTSTSA